MAVKSYVVKSGLKFLKKDSKFHQFSSARLQLSGTSMSIRSSSIKSIFLALLVGTVQVLSQSDANPPVVTRCSEWKSDTPLQGVLGTGASQVYAGAGNGTLFSLDSKSLVVKWRVELGGEFVSDSISMDGTVAVVTSTSAGKGEGAESSTLRLLSSETGVVDWSARLGYADRYHLGRSAAGLACGGGWCLARHAGGGRQRGSLPR